MEEEEDQLNSECRSAHAVGKANLAHSLPEPSRKHR